ncbi:MAG: bifunctional pyr operon transcriptional regulator/uracil phosphoribosyltransferase PyrR [Acaryochloris sp. RU_4_1]|nr:bifunctional pyr operon transcriptional regulator/uracil phosphoribosyltransferase PyrR [Acaryochloris sp. RU_4_1]NJR53597.1 bifunctional pyr operon transcriptional regulator/uracil phosphoribosyltransferase PyrR [Acaryochloris sp. CRU_2_0]
MSAKVVEILSSQELHRTLTRLASEVIERIGSLDQLVLLGIPTRGIPLATALAEQIALLEQVQVPVGTLDITFYRDDLDQITVRTPGKTELPTDLSGKIVLLVDDVIYSGRTIGAALSAIHDYGRPMLIQLLVLIDRGHRELPIHPDFIGKVLPTGREEQVKVYLEPTDGHDGVELVRRDHQEVPTARLSHPEQTRHP